MKKIGILLITLMVISVGFLSGCTNEQGAKTSNSIIGQWVTEVNAVIAFYEDGTVSFMNGSIQYDGTYSITDLVLTLTIEILGVKTTKVYKYEFQDKDTLIIKELTGEEATWTRI